MNILIKFPTRGRPHLFLQAVTELFKLTVEPQKCFLLVSLDSDDETMRNPPVLPFEHRYVIGESISKIHAVNRDFVYAPAWDICMTMSDDMRPAMTGWDAQIRADMQAHFPNTDGVLHYNCGGINGDSIMTLSIVGRKYYQRDNYIYYPQYKSFFCDTEQTEVAHQRGCYWYSPNSICTHHHPTEGKGNWDRLYRRNEIHWEHDAKLFEQRKTINFGL